MRLVIASNNEHKIREIKEILGGFFDDVVSMREAGINIDVEEDGKTFLENAKKKAFEIHKLLPNDAVLADDSGLVVDALNGAPGVLSARFALDGHNDKANNKKLLGHMKGVPTEKRTARFVCAAVLYESDGSCLTSQGTVQGRILETERGSNGFGYDPLFLYEPEGKTFAELSAEVKNEISHRRKALSAMFDVLNSHK